VGGWSGEGSCQKMTKDRPSLPPSLPPSLALTCCSLPKSGTVCELQEEDEVYTKQWGETFESAGVGVGRVLARG